MKSLILPIFALLYLINFLHPISSKLIDANDLHLHTIPGCCSMNIRMNETELLKCVNSSAEQTVQMGWQQIDNSGIDANTKKRSSKNKYNQKLKIAFITYGTNDILHYSSYAFAINQVYAEQNRHLLRLTDPLTSNFEPADVRWNKVKILELALKSWAKSCDYIIWLDADLVILDLTMDLDSLIQQYSNYHLLASASPESTTNTDVMNSGMLILKNSKFINSWLLKEWWNYDKRNVYSDQEVFNMLYMKYSEKLASKVVILPPDTINSDPPATLKQTNVGQVLHLMGEYDIYRHQAFKLGFDEICRIVDYQNSQVNERISDDGADGGTDNNGTSLITNTMNFNLKAKTNNSNNSKVKLQNQLGLHQERLLALSIINYYNKSTQLLTQFQTKLDNKQFNAYLEYSALTYYIKRYIDMMYHIESKWNSKDLKALSKGEWTKLDARLLKDQVAVNKQYVWNIRPNVSSVDSNSSLEYTYSDSIFPGLQGYKDRNQSVLGIHNRTSDEWRMLIFQLLMQNLELYGTDYSTISTEVTDEYDDENEGEFDSQSCSNDENGSESKECRNIKTDSADNNVVVNSKTSSIYVGKSKAAISTSISTSKSAEEIKFERASLLYFTVDFGATLVKHYLVNKINNNSPQPTKKISSPADANNDNEKENTIEQIQSILTQMLTLSHELIDIVEYPRRPHVHHLRADLLIDQSVLTRYLQQNQKQLSKSKKKSNKKSKKKSDKNKDNDDNDTNTSSSIDFLYQALYEKEQEAKQLGELCLIKVLIMISDQLSQSQDFHSSFAHFERAIEIHEKNLGTQNQVVLGTYYFMYGQAKASVRDYKESIKIFSQAKRIFELFPASSEYQRDLPRVNQLIQYCQERL